MLAPTSRGSWRVVGSSGVVRQVFFIPRRDVQKPACARKHTQLRERGAGGRNGGGGVPSNWGKRADAICRLEAR